MIKHFTTSIFIINKAKEDLQILLIHHKKFNRWMVAGGHIENFENPVECAIREVKEETGLDIELFSFLNKKIESFDSQWLLPPEYFYQQQIPTTTKEETHYHLDFAYLAFAREEKLVFNEKETTDIKWFTIENALNLNLFDGTKMIIKDILYKFKNNKEILYIQEF